MSYDPRQGQSPYLGMDAEDAPRTHVSTRRGEPRTSAPTTRQPGRQAARMPRTSQATMAPATIRRNAARAPYPAAATATASADATVLRRQQTPRPSRPVEPASPRRRQVVAAPPQAPRARRSGPLALLGSLSLRALSLVSRIGALLLFLVVMAAALSGNTHRAFIVAGINLASTFAPAALVGKFVFETPFGGAFRGDFALMSVALFVIDWYCLVLSTSLLQGRERGA